MRLFDEPEVVVKPEPKVKTESKGTLKVLTYVFYPVLALVALMDYKNGKGFKKNFETVTANNIEIEGPNYDKNKKNS